MKTDEAIAECRRWFQYCENEEEQTRLLQKAASLARAGKREESQRIVRHVDRKPVVFDGANLLAAVRHLVEMTAAERGG